MKNKESYMLDHGMVNSTELIQDSLLLSSTSIGSIGNIDSQLLSNSKV
jgi:hypothetical protein